MVTRTYRSWQQAKNRCFNQKAERFADYGGRGITMCQEWRKSFAAFLADMGERPEGLMLERINNDGDYEPGNCCWASPMAQARNKRNNRLIEHEGRLMTTVEAAERLGISPNKLRQRLYRGWTVGEAVAGVRA
jgi:hypothetical protein